MAYDKVCLAANDTCAKDFSFMTVTHFEFANGASLPVSGLIGMSPSAGGQNLLMEKLLENNDID